MRLSQTAEMGAAEPLMAIGGIVGAFGFLVLLGWIQSKFGWLWCHAMVSAPYAAFWITVTRVESAMRDSAAAFFWGCGALLPFVVLWIVRFSVPMKTEWRERIR